MKSIILLGIAVILGATAQNSPKQLYQGYQYLLFNRSNITLGDTKYNQITYEQERKFLLSWCFGNLSLCQLNPLNNPTIWVTSDLGEIPNTLSMAQTLGIPVVVFVTNEILPYYLTDQSVELVLTMGMGEAKKARTLSNGENVELIYKKTCNCSVTHTPINIGLATLAGWIIVAVLWRLALSHWYSIQVVYIHKMLTALLVLRIIIDLIFVSLLWTCPWDKIMPEYFETMLSSFDTVYKSLLFTILLLLSYGYSTVTNYLSNEQITVCFCVLAGTYVLYSSYYISAETVLLRFVISQALGVYQVLMLFYYVRNTATSISTLVIQENILHNEENMNNITSALHCKIILLKLFLVVLTAYFSVRFFFFSVVPFFDYSDSALLIFSALESVSEISVVSGIMLIFHPAYYTTSFQISTLDIGIENEGNPSERIQQATFQTLHIKLSDLQKIPVILPRLDVTKSLIILSPQQQFTSVNLRFLMSNAQFASQIIYPEI